MQRKSYAILLSDQQRKSGHLIVNAKPSEDMGTRSMQDGHVAFRLDDSSGSRPAILLFAPSERSPAYENQIALLSDDNIVRELDADFVQVFAEGTSRVGKGHLEEASVEELRSTFRVDENDFLIVFLGKNGKELYRSDAPVQASVIIERFTDGSRAG